MHHYYIYLQYIKEGDKYIRKTWQSLYNTIYFVNIVYINYDFLFINMEYENKLYHIYNKISIARKKQIEMFDLCILQIVYNFII